MTAEQDKQTVSAPAGLPVDARQVLADQLVEQAKTDGISLIGPGGLLSDITKRVLETGLEVERTDHLGYEQHSAEGRNGGNSRNGTRSKTVITDIGPESAAPQSSFDLGDLLDRLRPAAGWEISPEPNSAGLDRGAAVEPPDLGIDFGP